MRIALGILLLSSVARADGGPVEPPPPRPMPPAPTEYSPYTLRLDVDLPLLLLGTTLWGGTSFPVEPVEGRGCGTVFRLTPPPKGSTGGWTESILYRQLALVFQCFAMRNVIWIRAVRQKLNLLIEPVRGAEHVAKFVRRRRKKA